MYTPKTITTEFVNTLLSELERSNRKNQLGYSDHNPIKLEKYKKGFFLITKIYLSK